MTKTSTAMTSGEKTFQVIDGFEEGVSPFGHDEIDRVEASPALEAASEITTCARDGVGRPAVRASKHELLTPELRRDIQLLDDHAEIDLIPQLAKEIG